MVSSIIRNFIAKRMFQQKGAIANNKSVEFSANALEQRLKNLGVDPNTIKSEGELNQILSFVKQAEDQAFNQKFGNMLGGSKFDRVGEVLDMTGKKLDSSRGIIGGTQINEKSLKEGLMKTDNPFSDLVKTTKKGPKTLAEREAEVLARMNRENKEAVERLKNKKDPPEELAGGGVAGLLGERTGYKDGKDVFIGPKRKKKTKKELEDEKKLKEKIAAYLESQTINLPEEDPLKKYQPTDYSLYGGFMDNVKMKEDRTGNIINDFNNISIDPKDARVGISRFNPKTNSSFVAGAGPSGFNINLTKQFADGGPARQNFAMGKRAFLKFMGAGAAGIAGLKTGLFGLGKKAAVKTAAPIVAEAAVVPPHFLKLVAKIKSLGDDITETGALAERQSVKKYKDYEMTTDNATGSIEIQKTKPFAEGSDNFGNGLTEDVYMSYKPGEQIIGKGGKPIKTQPEYEEGTAYLRNDGPNTGDVYEEVSGVTDDIFKEVGEEIPEAIRKGKADGGRIGYAKGKGVMTLLDLVKNKFGKKSITTADNIPTPQKTLDRNMFKKADDRLNDKRQMTDDEYQDFADEIGENIEAYDFDGTVGDAKRIIKDIKDYEAEMFAQYKMGKLDPVAGDKSSARKRFLQNKLDEAEGSGDSRLITRDEMDELESFDLSIDNIKMSPEDQLRNEFPGIEDRLIKNILTDDNPQRIAEVKQTMREALEMQNKGMGSDDIITTFKGTTRRKQATGGLAAMLGE